MAKKLIKKRYFKKQKAESGINREKLGKKKNIPNNNRKITEVFNYFKKIKFSFRVPQINPKIIFFIILFIPVACVTWARGIEYYNNLQEKQSVEAKKQKISKEIEFWKNITNKHQDYRDAYFQIAILEYQLNNIKQAKVNLDRALELDPNFENGRVFEKLLEKI